jgi:hypothetical protein
MRYLTLFLLLISINIHAQEKEGDLALPVSDLEIERQEEELPPTIDEVEIKQHEEKQSDNHRDGSGRTDGRKNPERRKY